MKFSLRDWQGAEAVYEIMKYLCIWSSTCLNIFVVKKAESGDDSEYDELAEAVDDLSRVVDGKPIRLRRKKKKRKEEEDEYSRNPVFEQPIVAEEFIPLMDDSIAKTDGKGLLNVRVIFVIGEPNWQFSIAFFKASFITISPHNRLKMKGCVYVWAIER